MEQLIKEMTRKLEEKDRLIAESKQLQYSANTQDF